MKTNFKAYKKQILFLTTGLGMIILFLVFLPSIRKVYYFKTSTVETFEGKKVRAISARGKLKGSISIPDKMWFSPIVGIAENAFSGCEELDSIEIPETIEFISSSAFQGCTGLESITFPKSLSYIGDYAFQGCINLRSISTLQYIQQIWAGAFQNCESLISITLPQDLDWIAEYTFQGCTNLKSINIPKGVEAISTGTFQGCESLTSITLPQNVDGIGRYAFQGCESLTSITLPQNVTTIGNNAFNGCSDLHSINIPDRVTEINDSTFYGCNSLKSITLPKSVTKIREYAFQGCASLTSIIFPESLKSISKSSFQDCENLTALTFQGEIGVFGIHDRAFQNCKKIKSVRFKSGDCPNHEAFADCPLLHRKKLNSTDEWWEWLIIQRFKYSGSDDSMCHYSVTFSGEEENRRAWIDSHCYDVLYYGIRSDGKFGVKLLDRELRNMGIILYCDIVVDSETGELWCNLRSSRFYFKN